MLESLPVALIVGTLLGFLTGLGVGGGSLLILWLTLVLEMSQTAARGIPPPPFPVICVGSKER